MLSARPPSSSGMELILSLPDEPTGTVPPRAPAPVASSVSLTVLAFCSLCFSQLHPHLATFFQDFDISTFLSYDPSELRPAPSPPAAAPVMDQLLCLRALLDRAVDVVVQDCSEVAGVLQDLEGLVPADHFVRMLQVSSHSCVRWWRELVVG